MALPILHNWKRYFDNHHEGLGSSYERIILNDLLLKLKHKYSIRNVLEAPSFGFTGVSGINSVMLAQSGCNLTLVDFDEERLAKIRQILNELQVQADLMYLTDYSRLPYENEQFDLAWNFSALWFVPDINSFLSELRRITKKAILICVPNSNGLGYRFQKASTDIPREFCFKEENINSQRIIRIMNKLQCRLVEWDYIDCPPWPDIGVLKEELLSKLGLSSGQKQESPAVQQEISIINYYNGSQPDFAQKMKRYAFFENYALRFLKRYWAHHIYLLFECNEEI